MKWLFRSLCTVLTLAAVGFVGMWGGMIGGPFLGILLGIVVLGVLLLGCCVFEGLVLNREI